MMVVVETSPGRKWDAIPRSDQPCFLDNTGYQRNALLASNYFSEMLFIPRVNDFFYSFSRSQGTQSCKLFIHADFEFSGGHEGTHLEHQHEIAVTGFPFLIG